jgi:Uma2 family endonuclease
MDRSATAARDAPGRRAPAGLVRQDDARVDWSRWYLTDEADMGEGFEQGEIIRTLVASLEVLAGERGWVNRLVGADQFFAWRRDEPLVRVSPDVYILEDAPPPPRPASWQTWRAGHRPPAFAVEIVSSDWKKDYEEAPAKYWQLGCPELLVFDPDAALGSVAGERVALQLFRRDADGAYLRLHAGAGPVHVLALDAFLVPRCDGATARLRIARDPRGVDLVATHAEARAVAETRAAESDAGRAVAEARVRELEARLRAAERAREEE